MFDTGTNDIFKKEQHSCFISLIFCLLPSRLLCYMYLSMIIDCERCLELAEINIPRVFCWSSSWKLLSVSGVCEKGLRRSFSGLPLEPNQKVDLPATVMFWSRNAKKKHGKVKVDWQSPDWPHGGDIPHICHFLTPSPFSEPKMRKLQHWQWSGVV